MSKNICFKSVVEWAHREHYCNEVDFFLRDMKTNKEDHLKLVRYNNSLIFVEGNTNDLVGTIDMYAGFYTNRVVSKYIHFLLGLDGTKYHVTVTYRNLARELDCFEFTAGGNDD